MNSLLRSFKTKLGQAPDFGAALSCLAAIVNRLGFPTVDYGYIRAPIGPDGNLRALHYYMENAPPTFSTAWEWGGSRDPMYVAGLARSVPIDVAKLEESSTSDTRCRPAWSYLKKEGLTQAILVPMHLPGGGYSTVAAYWRSRLPDPEWERVYDRFYDPMFLIAHYFHDALTRSSMLPEESSPDTALTARERECLELIAQGKTTDQVALMLGRSAVTVRFHLGNAFRKLGATNRVGAIAEALKQGYIALH
jgi:LuxR family transcriptional regulator